MFQYLTDKGIRFLILAGVFVFLAWFLFFLSIPPLQNVDEDGHYAYVQSLSYGHYPELALGESEVGSDLRAAYHMNDVQGGKIFNYPQVTIDPSRSDYIDKSIQGYHPPLYYFVASLVYQAAKILGFSAVAIFYLTKLTSLFFLSIFLAAFWKVIKLKWDDKVANYLTLAVALQPTLLMVSVSINPEIGAIALFTLTLGTLIYGLKNCLSDNVFAMLLVTFSVGAVLCKFNVIILVPVIVLVLWFASSNINKRRVITAYISGTAGLLMIWLFFNLFHFGSFLPHNSDIYATRSNEPGGNWVSLFFSFMADFKLAIVSLPGNFGYGSSLLFYEMRIVYVAFVFFFVGLGIWYFLRQDREHIKSSHFRLVSTLSLSLMFLFYLVYSWKLKSESFLGWIYVLQGRYLLIALLPATLLLFAGILQAVRIRHPENLAKGLFLVSLLYYLANLLYVIIPRYYV